LDKHLDLEDIDMLLEFLPYFKKRENTFYKIDKEDIFYPYNYSLEVQKFFNILRHENIIYPFDWVNWQNEAVKYFDNPCLLDDAGIKILKKLFTLHLRKERFCSGHFAEIIKSGHLVKMLERLKEIRKEIVKDGKNER